MPLPPLSLPRTGPDIAQGLAGQVARPPAEVCCLVKCLAGRLRLAAEFVSSSEGVGYHTARKSAILGQVGQGLLPVLDHAVHIAPEAGQRGANGGDFAQKGGDLVCGGRRLLGLLQVGLNGVELHGGQRCPGSREGQPGLGMHHLPR